LMVPVDVWEAERPKPGANLIIGFVDVGLVGVIAARYMVEELGMKMIGGIDAPSELPLSPVKEGVSQYPIGIYYKHPWLVLLPEVPLPPSLIYPVAMAITDYGERRGVERIISLTGLANVQRIRKDPEAYWIVNSVELVPELEKLKEVAKPLRDGVLYGPTATILKVTKTKGIASITLLADAFPEFPDPGAAAKVLETLKAVYNVEIDTKRLIEDSEKIKARLQEMAARAKEMVVERGQPTMYA